MKKLSAIFACIIFVSFSVSLFAFSPPPPEPENRDIFDTYVAIGDSLTHGFQSGSVDETRQPFSYPALIAERMATSFTQPLLKFPGYLVNIEDVGKGNIPWYKYYYPLVGGKRVDGYDDQSILNNFGITGADVTTVMESDGSEGGFYKLVLGNDGEPAAEQAIDRDPTFITMWAGNNDVLSCALWTDPSHQTAIDVFRQKLANLVDKVLSASSLQGVVMANVPDVCAIPYLEDANDPDVPYGSMKAFWNSSVSDNDEVLDPSEIQQVREGARLINQEIRNTAVANGWAFVDANAIFDEMAMYGHALKRANGNSTGRIVTTDYLGGVFSLDGVHPSVTGHAIAANLFIEAINYTYDMNLEMVDEYAASEKDTLYKDPYDPRGLINSWIGRAVQFVVELFI